MANDEWMDLAIMGLGAGLKGWVTGLVGQFLPGVTEDIGAIIVGGLLYYFGDRVHPLLQKFGAGVLIAGIGQMTSGLVAGGTVITEHSSGTETETTTTSVEAIAEAEASKTVETRIM